MEAALFALFLLAIAIGFFLGRRSSRVRGRHRRTSALAFEQRYLAGLTQLLKDQPDTAVETFVASLDVNGDTLETHLALGALMRRRGEVDKAIRIHQNLLSRSSLSPVQNDQVQLELALDYKKSGLLDRQEALLRDLIRSQDLGIQASALGHLVDVYQEGQEWRKAIETADLLCQKKYKVDLGFWRHLQAHYCCELAEQSRNSDCVHDFRRWTEQALKYERTHPRAALNMCWWELDQGTPKSALKWLDVAAAEPTLAHEVATNAAACLRSANEAQRLTEYLHALYQRRPGPTLLLPVIDLLSAQQGQQAALTFLQTEGRNIEGLRAVSDLVARADLSGVSFQTVREVVAANLPLPFQCRQCGFEGVRTYWCCPTCKHWL